MYLGKHNENTVGAYIINGKKTHPKSCNSKGWKQNIKWIKKYIDPNATEFITEGKHKYIFCFEKN